MNQNLIQKKIYFALLYFTEGAPIGFLWIALPTLFREQGLSIESIAQYSSILVLPWSFKFLWAPIIDTLKTPRFNYHAWMIGAQIMMGLTLVPLLFLNLNADFKLCTNLLILHAFFSSVQDICIDSLAISITDPSDHGKINGWMQMGQFLGQSAFGGGTILMMKFLSFHTVVILLISVIFILGLISARSAVLKSAPAEYHQTNLKNLLGKFKKALWRKSMLLGLLFALTVLSAEKAFTGLVGPYLLDRGFDKTTIGTFLALPAIILTILGSLSGGYIADKFGKKLILTYSIILLAVFIGSAVTWVPNSALIIVMCFIYFMTGITITTAYSLLMNMTDPLVAATQFSALMGMINLCESYSMFIVGKLSTLYSYPTALIVTCAISLSSLIFLKLIRESKEHKEENLFT